MMSAAQTIALAISKTTEFSATESEADHAIIDLLLPSESVNTSGLLWAGAGGSMALTLSHASKLATWPA